MTKPQSIIGTLKLVLNLRKKKLFSLDVIQDERDLLVHDKLDVTNKQGSFK